MHCCVCSSSQAFAVHEMSISAPANIGEAFAKEARRPLPKTAGEKIVEGERLRDEAQSLVKGEKPKKASVRFRTVFAYTKGLIPQTSELALYAAATGQQTVIDQHQEGAVVVDPASLKHNHSCPLLRACLGVLACDASPTPN